MRRLKLTGLRAGLGPFGAEMRVSKSERDLLHPLFVILRDKRALLYATQGRTDREEVTRSVEAIRGDLTFALKALGPDAVAAGELERLRRACREYLDAVAGSRNGDPVDDFALALDRLRASFREVASAIASDYDLPSAGELVEELGPHAAPRSASSGEPGLNHLLAASAVDHLDNGLWSIEQLAELEREIDVHTIWILGQDFHTDMLGMPFHEAVCHNMLDRNITYAYVAPDQPTPRQQLTALRHALDIANDDTRMLTVLLDDERWSRLPYTAGNVTVYDPLAGKPVPAGFFWYPGGNGESFGRLGDYVVLQWVAAILEVCPELDRASR
jgi:hypothetical protein